MKECREITKKNKSEGRKRDKKILPVTKLCTGSIFKRYYFFAS